MIYIYLYFGKFDEGSFSSPHPAKLVLILCQFITVDTKEPFLGEDHDLFGGTWEPGFVVCCCYLLKHQWSHQEDLMRLFSSVAVERGNSVAVSHPIQIQIPACFSLNSLDALDLMPENFPGLLDQPNYPACAEPRLIFLWYCCRCVT